jgi:hypothetical protein
MKVELKRQRDLVDDTDTKYPVMQELFNKKWN